MLMAALFTIARTWKQPRCPSIEEWIKKPWYRDILEYCCCAKSLQSCPTLCDPIDGSPPCSPSLGFSRQELWSGLPFPSPMHEVKRESEVAQSCPTLSDPLDCSLPGSSIHGIFQARILEWGAIAFSAQRQHPLPNCEQAPSC